MLWMKRLTFLLSCQCLLIAAQGPGPGPGRKMSPAVSGSSTMQSRTVDTRISLEVAEGLPSGTIVGSIPIKSNFTYRFNEPPAEFSLDANTGIIRTTMILDRESFRTDRFDLVVLSSQPTYPIEVRIVVTDTNDNAPEFPEPSITVKFSESSAPGTRLLLDSAFDRDLGVNGILTYAIVAGNKDQKFRINVTSNPSGEMSYLHLETTGNLDRETRAFYHLNISARDGGEPPLYGYLQVNVTILDVNDNPPMFDHSDYNVSLNESVSPGTSVLQVRATDNDIGDNAKITYNLEDIGRQFSIDSETGVISTTEPLVCVRQQNCSELSLLQGGCPKSCVISVSAWDHGSPRQVGRAYVTVNLIEVNTNDHDPIINFTYFLRPAKFATVDENAANGSVVAAVTVVDLDEGLNGETTVVIKSGNELNHFRLDSTPAVRVNGILDREEISKYNLTIVATDKGSPPRSSSASLIIHVNDVNDHEPVFEKSEYSVVLSELSPPGTYVAGITATDEDTGVNAQIYYAFVSGNERNWFDINTDSGLITTRTFIDREVQGSVELKISARDGGPNPKWAYTQLKVTILDENDGKPKFSQDRINVTLSEDSPPNTLVAILTASDSDQGTNGSVAYSLDTELQHTYQGLFALDTLTGQLTTKMKLDREMTPEYEIRVIAKDQGVPPQSSSAVVHLFVEDVNDNSPEFYPLKYFAPVPEDVSAGTSVLRVAAHDIDEGQNAELRYAIESGQDGLFEIDSKTGVISIASPLKYSKKALFEIVVTVRDLEGRKCPENAVVEIIKENRVQDMEFDSYGGYEFKIKEDEGGATPAIGTKVGKIQIRTDQGIRGIGEDIRYHIIQGDEGKSFSINDRTGVISRIKAIDREEKAFYTLKCIARANLAYGWTMVNITVIDVNDNRPTFEREKDEVEVNENAPVGLEIYQARARDRDDGANSRFRYALTANPESRFRVNEATGVVYLNRKIHKPPGTRIPIEITVTDFGEPPLTSRQIITIIVRDVNDHTPVFDHTSYETSLLESTPVNDRFFRLSATDDDLNLNGMILYTITEGNNEGNFGIFPDGYLYVKSPLDRENKDYYSLVVAATDAGDPPRRSTVSVVIHVIDENDNRPEFTNSTFTFHILENEPPDSFVGKLTATDSDIGRNAELTFSFANVQDEFVVDPKNGFVKTLIVFDREELTETTGTNFISLEAVVNDNGQSRLKDKATVNVYIDDVNDNPPVFVKTPYKVQISEGSTVDMQVLRVHAFDADEGINGEVRYSLLDGNEEGKFSIETGTGQITLSKELDRETTSRYTLTVMAEDGASSNRMSVSTTVVIDVLDENDNAPEFVETESKISVPETTPINTKLSQFKAVDRDLGINSEIVFSIGAGNRRDTFHVDSNSGVLYLHKALDYEELNSYTLTIVASDGGNPRLSSTILFNVAVEDSNDNAPVFPNTALVRQILEGIPVNKAIVTVTAEDPDSGNNGKVTYSIGNQEPKMPNGQEKHFGINPVTGVIYTLLPIDREVVDTFLLTVVATDQAQPESARLSSEKLVTVIVEDINDNAPVFVSMKAAVLPKDRTHVTNVHARDLDSNTNGLVTYDLVSGDVDLFKLDINTGALSLRQVIPNPRPRYHLGVKATDEAVQTERKSTEAYVTLFATSEENLGPNFDRQDLRGSVYENEPPGKSILTVSAKMDNVDVEYFVTNVTGNGKQVDCLFDVDAKTGVLSNAVVLDREKGSESYTVEIYAIGANTTKPFTSKAEVRIDVLDKNDSPPSFGNVQLEYSVSEDLPPGHVITTLQAQDPDTIGKISYNLVGGDDGKFLVEPSTGILRLNDSLDRETKDLYKVQIRASDGIQYTDAILKVRVIDTNDNPPVFPDNAYSFDIPENTVRGTRVGEIVATDEDEGVNGQVSYQVISDWANDIFSLNPQSGVFTLTGRLDYEEVQHYIFVVQAQDMGKPSLSSTVTVYFNVMDLNDNAPLFDPLSYNNEVFENVTVGTNVGTVSATDLDSGRNGQIEYRITSGDENEDLTIVQNGTIYTVKKLDRETKPVYNLIVTGTDLADPPQQRLSSAVQVSIVLKDVNDMSAEFITPNETSVSENIPPNTVVLAVKAVDKDEGRNSYLEYSLRDPSKMFTVGPVDGLLRVIGRLDRETRANYTLEVTAKDRGDPPRSNKQTILVNVLDENDNNPMFDPKHYSASIAENASIGASVLQVSATDVDEGPNGRVRYSIFLGDENRDFSISEDTGVVRVAKNLNFERKSRYLLTVRAEDSSNDDEDNVRYDTATISIIIRDINDNPPTFLDSPYMAYVMENTVPQPDGYFLTVRALDADTPQYNGQVRYFLKEGDAGLFRINASTGDISLLRALDRETQSEYLLTLVAMDTGTPPLTGSGTVKVVVQDVNDHSPEFERQSYTASILENSPVGTFVVQPKAKDSDAGLNAKIKYSFFGEKSERFSLDEDTGIIRTAVVLDREEISEYHLAFVARDCSLTEPKTTAVNLTVNVLDDNDNSPKFDRSEYTVYVPDNTVIGQFVFGAKANDRDVGRNSQITYRLQGTSSGNFVIAAETGVIKTAKELSPWNEASGTVYALEIIAEDGGSEPQTTSAKLTVKIRPKDWFPKITAPIDQKFTLPENTVSGKVITKLSAVSARPDTNGGIRYAIAGGNVGDALKVDANTGEVTVADGRLDYETSPIYEVWVEAHYVDEPSLRTVLQLVINVTDTNDNPPVIEQQMYNASIYEEEYPPLKVCTVKADDLDSASNGQITYRLVEDCDGTFSINEETGEISTETKLDRETAPSYSLIVEAIDHGAPQLTGTATVLVTVLDKNDNPPRFTRLFSANVTENAELGSFVLRVTSSDQDIGEYANATYSFTENPGMKFHLDPLTGNVTVAGPLDRETQDEYLLKVAAFDGAWRSETPLTITIQDQNDNAPEFEHSYYNFNFPELQTSVVFVGQVVATDRDKHGPNSVISYSLKHPSDLFTIDPASGELFSKRTMRYKYTALETSPENQYTLMVLATDNGKPPMSSECLVTVNVVDSNNNRPKFSASRYFSPVPRTSQLGQNIFQVVATDETDYGINAELEYEISGGNGSEHFLIDRKTGWIRTSKIFLSVPELTKFFVSVRAVDKGVPPLEDTATVQLIVTGDNLHTPVFSALSFQVIIPENDPVGSTILSVVATDNDDGPNGEIRYKISSGNEESKFGINETTGALRILQPLDYDTVSNYHLNVTATDLGFEPRQATAMVRIALTDVNDNPPRFNQTVFHAYIPENSPPRTLVCKVQAQDVDSPKNAIIEYSITNGSGKGVFTIDAKTGEIYSKTELDFEENDEYDLEIQAGNPGSSMYGFTKMVVHVTGVNEFYPKFVRPVFHFEISESSEVGTSVGRIEATDSDAGEDGKVYYLFVGSSNDKGFSIGPETGVILVSRRLDRETQNRVVLTVVAKNAGGIRGNDTDEAQVIISIQDGNDPPEFLLREYETRVSEAIRPGKTVIVVKAVDTDVRPQNNQFSYSIISGNVGKSFKIDPQTGVIETTMELDREKVPVYTLVVGAIDVGVPPQTGTATVRIILNDVNDNGPAFDPPNLIGYVTENEPPNTSVMTLKATDPDLPPNGGPFSYYIVGGRDKDFVYVEKSMGVIRTKKAIDRETNPQLDVVVRVEDSGVPKQKSEHAISIVVLDQNDSPSTPRTVRVLVHYFNDDLPTEKIADVHPNDADAVGEYRCKIVSGSIPKNTFHIKHGCELTQEKVSPEVKYTLSVSGNDGKHPDVISKVSVEFFQFTNSTVDNAFTVRVENTTSTDFLTNHLKSFMETVKSAFESKDQVHLFSLTEMDSGLELTMAVKDFKGSYYGRGRAVENLTRRRQVLQQTIGTAVAVGYSPCQKVTCENGGICSDGIEVLEGSRITDSQNVIFTSPLVTHDYRCRCPDGFTGKRCDRQHDPCSPNPCQASGTCRRQGYDFQCSCPASREGKLCEHERGNACSGNPCRNGGTCQQSPDGFSFFCLCRPGYRGNHCETVSDSCRPNPCLHGGVCISLKPGYRCSCTQGRYGRHCEKSTFGFNEFSYMTFPPLDVSTNDISVIFATTKPNALLIYNYGMQSGGRSDFVAVELLGGKAVFSYGGARSAITSVSVPRGNASLANGAWHKITATRNGRVISLSVASCTDNGDNCQDCRAGDINCFADDIGPTGTLNFNNQPMLVGGLASTDPVLERPGQVHSDDLVGCVHSISINGRALNLSSPLTSQNVDSICGRSRSPCASSSQTNEVVEQLNPCGEGKCLDRWKSHQCICSGLISTDCSESLEPITLLEGSFLEFKISEKHLRMQLLENFYHGSTLWDNTSPSGRWRRYAESSSSVPAAATDGVPVGSAKSLSIIFRTIKKEGLLVYSSTNKDFTSVELRDGRIVYVSRLGASSPTVNMTVADLILSDGHWHNLTLHSHNRGLRLIIDNKKAGEELDSEGVHDFLDPYLTSLSIGGIKKDSFQSSSDSLVKGFEGCIANFTINNEIQPFNGSGSVFAETVIHGKVLKGCAGSVGVGATTAPDPLSIGVTLVIVFFVTLLVAILVSFVVFHLRRQKKEKEGSPVGRGNMAISKQNGGATLVAGSDGLVGSADGVLGRGLHGEANVGYLAETADALRGHHLVAPELISKKYREREILGSDTQRHSRPDIIEREVVSKSPLLREEHPPSPPTQVSSAQTPHNHDGSEIPEHYDLENASSIAPSDTDIVYHYKGYRDAGMRKYKPTPPHIPSGRGFHHKHAGTQQQHRHSPHMTGGFAPPTRDSPRSAMPPPPVSRVESPQSVVNSLNSQASNKLLPHQSTPLARLSPSSELSSQQPRILTLSDISGKPLQSALLATTSSSGGVGKDILHSNSERSLNSPVTSQLSGQSSSTSRKNQAQAEGSSGNGKSVFMGLTAEEIGRLNCHPRTSSLVSTLDAVSSSSEAPRPRQSHHLTSSNNIPDNASSTTTDESGNDSFTCSEIEYDNNSLNGDKRSDILFSKLTEDEDGRRSRSNNSGTASKPPLPPPSYDGFDSSFRGSLSTLVASDDELSTHMGGLLYRGPNGSPSSTAPLGWDYLLNWGPNFESLVGVFKDIAELPDAVNGRVQTLRLPSQSPKPNEEYV